MHVSCAAGGAIIRTCDAKRYDDDLLCQGKPDQARDVLKQGLGSEDPSGADAGR